MDDYARQAPYAGEGEMGNKSPDAYRTISEVADDLDLPQHVLRFWETRFPQIKPLKRGGGRRYYHPDDVALIMGLKSLLYAEGYTIKGVQRILKEQGARAVQAVGRGDLGGLGKGPVAPAGADAAISRGAAEPRAQTLHAQTPRAQMLHAQMLDAPPLDAPTRHAESPSRAMGAVEADDPPAPGAAFATPLRPGSASREAAPALPLSPHSAVTSGVDPQGPLSPLPSPRPARAVLQAALEDLVSARNALARARQMEPDDG